MLELSGLVKRFPALDGEPVLALDHVSLSLERGELLALYGPSGSGKTTLLMLIAGLLRPDDGEILLDGREISRLSGKETARYRRRELGFVRQAVNLLPGADALDNAALKLIGDELGAREARERARPLLRRLGLQERATHRPEQLSAGERQRVMIARALSTDPRLVLADEPTGNLDTQRGGEVLALLREVCREREVAVLLATHDPLAASYADRVCVLCDGRLAEHESGCASVPVNAP